MRETDGLPVECCGNCLYGIAEPDSPSCMQCRRHAPKPLHGYPHAADEYIDSIWPRAREIWPRVRETDWCGEHEPRE